MKFLRLSSPSVPLLLLPSIVVASIVVAMPIALAFTTKTPLRATRSSNSIVSPSTTASLQSSPLSLALSMSLASPSRKKRITRTSLASRQRDDLEDQLWSIRNSWKAKTDNTEGTVYRSDVPSDNNSNIINNINNNSASNLAKEFKDRFLKLPPAPEDQFIMTGDIAVLFLYTFTSHSINDSVVTSLLDNPRMTIPEAIKEVDPLQHIVNLQHPVWVDLASNPNVPFANPSVDRALEVSARESLLNHWGPLLSTEGSACVALCTCWLIAGWFHKAFMFDNSTYCGANQALTKTVQTWLTSALLLACLATGTDWLVGHVPALQSLFCVTCKSAANGTAAGLGEFKAAMAMTTEGGGADQTFRTMLLPMVSFLSLTQSDVLFIVDSLTILMAWRWSAHRVLNIFR